jgi:hypothetical protein
VRPFLVFVWGTEGTPFLGDVLSKTCLKLRTVTFWGDENVPIESAVRPMVWDFRNVLEAPKGTKISRRSVHPSAQRSFSAHIYTVLCDIMSSNPQSQPFLASQPLNWLNSLLVGSQNGGAAAAWSDGGADDGDGVSTVGSAIGVAVLDSHSNLFDGLVTQDADSVLANSVLHALHDDGSVTSDSDTDQTQQRQESETQLDVDGVGGDDGVGGGGGGGDGDFEGASGFLEEDEDTCTTEVSSTPSLHPLLPCPLLP